jgi:hypothetical protein
MRLYDRTRWVSSTREDGTGAVVWTATTQSEGSSSDLRKVIDGMLLTAFKYFGQDTGEQKDRQVLIDSSDAEDLRARAASRPG